MAGGNVIRVPIQVEIENTKSIISDLQNALKNVKTDTKGYKEIESILSRAQIKLSELQKRGEQGFMSQSSLHSFENAMKQVLNSVEVAAEKMKEFNFDNLILTDDQKKGFSDLTAQMDALQASYNKLEVGKVQELANGSKEFADKLKEANVNLNADNIVTSLEKVQVAAKDATKELEKLERQRNEAANKASQARDKEAEIQRVKGFFADTKGLTNQKDIDKEIARAQSARANATDFFKSNGTFKNHGKDLLLQHLKDLGLDPDTLETLSKETGNKLWEAYDKGVRQALNKIQGGATRTATTNETSVKNLDNSIAQQQQSVQSFSQVEAALNKASVDPSIINAYKQLQEQLENLRQAYANLKAQVEDNAGVQKTAEKGMESVGHVAESTSGKIEQAGESMNKLGNIQKVESNLKNLITRWFGFYQVINLVRRGIRTIVSDIRALDKVMTEIAIVTNKTQSDLWAQVGTFQNIAKTYGVSTEGVYKVSQLYYQQGLDSISVMKLTTETLKMAKIAGLDYATATDYMTVAIRGFKMEMDDAQKVVDVYSNLASKSASTTEELATAMSKTASSAQAVGSSFENTSAFIAMMVDNTAPYNWKIILNPEYAGNSLELYLLNYNSDIIAA